MMRCDNCGFSRIRVEKGHPGRFSWLGWTVYIVLAFLAFGYSWHRDCKEWEGPEYIGPPKFFCAVALGAGWPLFIATKTAIWVTNPKVNLIPKLKWE